MNENSTCVIWGTPASEAHTNRDGRSIESARAGGKYFISGSAETVLSHSEGHVKVRLTTWLVEQRQLGTPCPEINSWTIRDVERVKDTNVSHRCDSILKYLEIKSQMLGVGVGIRVSLDMYQNVQLDELEIAYFELLAHSACINNDELAFLLKSLQNHNLINYRFIGGSSWGCTLTLEGYARLAELENTYTASSRAFVAMWFDNSMTEVWEHGFAPAIQATGYEPVRIDHHEHVNKIDDEIIAEIRRSRFVVADFTHGDTGARGGVYYEARFAHGLDIPVIFTCRNDSFDEIHFDTRQYNHIVWTEPIDLRRNLKDRIAAVIGDGPNVPLG